MTASSPESVATLVVMDEPQLERLPPLENGDHLTRPEFERRYAAIPRLKKAELIEQTVYLTWKVTVAEASAQADMIGWLSLYHAFTPGVEAAAHATVRLDWDNEPQPDGLLFLDPARGGQARIDAEDFIAGAPELVAEVATSSVSYDLHDKLNVYRRNGVCEYVVWRRLDRAIDWFVLREGRFEGLSLPSSGIYQSQVFPGLWLDPAALIAGDLARVHQVLQQGLASPEHAAFVARLQQTTSLAP